MEQIGVLGRVVFDQRRMKIKVIVVPLTSLLVASLALLSPTASAPAKGTTGKMAAHLDTAAYDPNTFIYDKNTGLYHNPNDPNAVYYDPNNPAATSAANAVAYRLSTGQTKPKGRYGLSYDSSYDASDEDDRDESSDEDESDRQMNLNQIALGDGLSALSTDGGGGGIALYPYDLLKVIWKQLSTDPYRLGISMAELKQVMHLFKIMLSAWAMINSMRMFVQNQNNQKDMVVMGLMNSQFNSK